MAEDGTVWVGGDQTTLMQSANKAVDEEFLSVNSSSIIFKYLFIHAGCVALMMATPTDGSAQHVVQTLMIFQTMNLNDFLDPLTFFPAPPGA